MDSTINPKPADDPHDVLVIASDAARMVPTDDELSRLARSLHRSADPQARTGPAGATAPPVAVPRVDTAFRPAATGDGQLPDRQRTAGGRAARAFTAALVLAVGSGAAAMAWQSYGGAAEQMIARWTPQLVAQPAPTAVAAIAANPAPPPPGSPVQAAPEGAAPAAVTPAPSVESAAPPLGAVTNDIAGMRQEIDQLKASIEELKAGQQQISRDVAKASEAKASEAKTSEVRASEPNLRPKMPAHPPLTAARLRKPVPPPLSPRQTAAYPALPPAAPYVPQSAAPYAPRQVEPLPPPAAEPPADPELASVPRPPMPLR
jgi:hypothetical protein